MTFIPLAPWDYKVRAYLPTNKGGELLIELVFRGEHSKDMDVDILKERMRRGEVGRIEIINLNPPYNVTTIGA